jgi:hypothetical protein
MDRCFRPPLRGHNFCVEHYEEIGRRFEQLAELHHDVGELLQKSPEPKHSEADKVLAQAERSSSQTCERVAASIRAWLRQDAPERKDAGSSTVD